MAAAYGFEPTAVPTIFIGDQHWVGYAEQMAPQLEAAIATCAAEGCRDAGLGVIPGIPTPAPTALPAALPDQVLMAGVALLPSTDAVAAPAPNAGETLVLPWFGAIDLATQSLAVSTALIAFVDGFNPCFLWVLSVLLALTLNTGSRRRVFLVGIVFLTVTSLVYMAFITGLFTMFSVISFVGWIQIAVALVALFFAAVNIKDYFWYKEGLSFTIADEQKPGIYRGMRRVLAAGDSTWALMGGNRRAGRRRLTRRVFLHRRFSRPVDQSAHCARSDCSNLRTVAAALHADLSDRRTGHLSGGGLYAQGQQAARKTGAHP